MIYLASPYAHADVAVMQARFDQMVVVVNKLYAQHVVCYSPIVHNHPVALLGGLPRTWDFWKTIDLPMLERCDELWVVKLQGWDKSVGVKAEIQHMHDCDKLICTCDPVSLETKRFRLYP